MAKKRKSKTSSSKALQNKIDAYRAILKNDHDWDYSYILEFLIFKLKRTRECIISNRIARNAPKISQEIKEVEILLHRVVKDRYHAVVFKGFYKKYGRPKIITGQAEPGARSVPLTIKYQKETPRNQKKIRVEASKLYRRAEKMRHMDLKRAFALMLKNIWGWWD